MTRLGNWSPLATDPLGSVEQQDSFSSYVRDDKADWDA
jgi:hypothetical protein